MDVNTVKCDVCGRQKQETNHWLVAVAMPGIDGVMFVQAENALTPREPSYKYEDICGQECAHKRLSQYLATLA